MLADCEFGFCALGTTKKKAGGAVNKPSQAQGNLKLQH